MICGKLCSGKSVYADALRKAGRAVILSVDEITLTLFGQDAGDSLDDYVAKAKTYLYRIYNQEHMPVFLRNYRYPVERRLDLRAMREAARCFTGTRDFRSFMTDAAAYDGSTVKTIYAAEVSGDGNDVTFAVTGSGFLYNMVRIMTGTLVDVGTGKIAPAEIDRILASGTRAAAGHTAPPQGLYMAEVYYSAEEREKGIARYRDAAAWEKGSLYAESSDR